jgi:hypothetical protein
MKNALIIMGILSIFNCYGQKLSQRENEIVKSIGFDQQLVQDLKKHLKTECIQLPAIDQETGDLLENETYPGIHFNCEEDKAKLIVNNLKPGFKERGYLIFVFGIDYNNNSVALIRGSEETEIIKYRRTDGINYGHENKDIVSKIEKWNNTFGLSVVGCGVDWLELKFSHLPGDLNKFAEEVYEFCPDSVDQGVESIENLKELIKQMYGIWLWWD